MQLIAHPTCDDTQTVVRARALAALEPPSGGTTTVSTAAAVLVLLVLLVLLLLLMLLMLLLFLLLLLLSSFSSSDWIKSLTVPSAAAFSWTTFTKGAGRILRRRTWCKGLASASHPKWRRILIFNCESSWLGSYGVQYCKISLSLR